AGDAVEAIGAQFVLRFERKCLLWWLIGDGDDDHHRHDSLTEPVRDTPSVARPYCPACEPDTDPSLEILDVRWCSAHTPASGRLDDEAVAEERHPAGDGEARGASKRPPG